MHCTALQCTVLYCTALQCTALHYNALYCTALYCTALHCTTMHCNALYCTALYCTVLHCTTMHCTALYCTALYCTVLYCTVLHYNALQCTVLHCTALYCTVIYYDACLQTEANTYLCWIKIHIINNKLFVQSNTFKKGNVWFQKMSIPPPWKVIENSKTGGGRVSTAKAFKGKERISIRGEGEGDPNQKTFYEGYGCFWNNAIFDQLCIIFILVESCLWQCIQSWPGAVSSHGWDTVWSSDTRSFSRQMWKEKGLVHFIYWTRNIWFCKFICSNLQNIHFTSIFHWLLYWWRDIICFCFGNRANWSILQGICWDNGTVFFYDRTIDSSYSCISGPWLEDIIGSAFFTILCFYIIF